MADWPTRDKTPMRVPYVEEALDFPISLRWKYELDENAIAPPIFVDGMLYVPCVIGVHALDTSRVKVDWIVRTEQYQYDEDLGHMIASPTMSNGLLYFCDETYITYCLDGQRGNELWRTREFWSSNESICSVGDLLILRTRHFGREEFGDEDPGYLAIDHEGEVEWLFNTAGSITTQEAAATDGISVFGDELGFFYAVDVRTGELRWKLRFNDFIPEVEGTDTIIRARAFPSIVGDRILVKTGSGNVIFCLGLHDGEVTWIHRAGMQTDRHASDGESMYFIKKGRENSLEAVDIESGEIALSKKLEDDALWETGVYEANGLVVGNHYFASFYKEAALAAFDTESGEMIWKHKTNAPINSSPIYADGHLYLVDLHGTVYCFGADS